MFLFPYVVVFPKVFPRDFSAKPQSVVVLNFEKIDGCERDVHILARGGFFCVYASYIVNYFISIAIYKYLSVLNLYDK